jgi:hypothetical protein
MRRFAAFVGRFTSPLYILTALNATAFVLYVGATANPTS